MTHASSRLSLCLLGALAVFAVGSRDQAAALPIVGNAQTVVRDVKGKLDNEARTLVVDSDVFLDEEVATGPNSGTRIVFKDGTNLELGENSRLVLTKLVFDPDPQKSEISVKALAGVFRWTSGNLPVGNYHISTPVATIGIRGTSLEWIVGANGLTTVALAKGSVTVTNARGASVTLEPNQATTVSPADPDGSQQPPTAAGPVPPAILQVVWKMTATINLFDAPSMSDPHSGGSGFIEQTGGYDSRLNPDYFKPPTSTTPTSGSPSSSGSPSAPAPAPAPASVPVTTPSNQTSSGVPLATAPVVTPTVVTPPAATGSAITSPVVTQPVVTPPVVIVTPPPSPSPTPIVTNIDFGAHAVGSTAPVGIALNTSALTYNIVIATIQMLNDTYGAFHYSGSAVGDSSANGPLAWLLEFVPPPGMPDQIFTGTFEITDALGNTWEWILTGNEVIASIAEPSTLALFLFGIAAIAWMRRRSLSDVASGEARCAG
jgi:hypothetical protein